MRFFRPTVCVAVSAVLLAACAQGGADPDVDETTPAGGTDSPAATEELTDVVVGVTPNTDVAPLYLGQQMGFFEEEGLALEMEIAQGGAAIVPAVVSGANQFGFSNVVSLMVAVEQGLPLQIAAPGAYSTGEVGRDVAAIVTMPDTGIEEPLDLLGEQIATNTLGNNFQMTASYVIDEAGGDSTELGWVEMPWPDMPAALAEGRIRAGVMTEPFLTTAIQMGAVPVLWNWSQTDPDFLIAAYFTTADFVESEPEVVAAFQRAVAKSLDYAQENPEELRAIIGTYTEIPEDVLADLTLSRFSSDLDPEHVQWQAGLAQQYGLLSTDLDVSPMLP